MVTSCALSPQTSSMRMVASISTTPRTRRNTHRVVSYDGRFMPISGPSSRLDGVLSLPELDDEVFPELNRQMRSLGFTGTKGAYELRKICADHVYQKFEPKWPSRSPATTSKPSAITTPIRPSRTSAMYVFRTLSDIECVEANLACAQKCAALLRTSPVHCYAEMASAGTQKRPHSW